MLVMPGTDFVGALPAELRTYVVFDIAVSRECEGPGGARWRCSSFVTRGQRALKAAWSAA